MLVLIFTRLEEMDKQNILTKLLVDYLSS
jgi:hypothetical protein